MISKVLCVAIFSLSALHQQAHGSTMYCDYEIEYSGQDPEYVLTEVRRSAYQQYEEVKYELESADFGDDEKKDRERLSMLNALEQARFELDEFLNELSVTMLRRMRAAYQEYGGGQSGYADEYARVYNEIWTETEKYLSPRLSVFREHCSRPQSLLGGVLQGVGSLINGLVGGGRRSCN